MSSAGVGSWPAATTTKPLAGRWSVAAIRWATIVAAIHAGDTSVEALGARLACGTQCGSCLPELKSLIEESFNDESLNDESLLEKSPEEEGRHARARTTPDTIDVA